MPTPHKEYLLSIDNGTQSVRAMLFDSEGSLIAKHSVPIEPYFSLQLGWAEQHSEYFWSALCNACQGLWHQLEDQKDRIAALSITTQRATAVALDEAFRPIRPTFSWLDQRKVNTQPALTTFESLVTRLLGLRPAVQSFHQKAESNWIAQMEPELWDKTARYLLISGYHIFKLTGQCKDAIASQVGYLPFDFKRHCWADPGDWKWRALPIKGSMLPELVDAGHKIGVITEAASRDTGIPLGLPVIASGSDKACEVLGSGCLDPEVGSMSYGSLATFNVFSDRYLEVIKGHPAYPGLVPGTFNIEMAVQRGYWMVAWFKQEFGLHEKQIADKLGVSTESLFDDLLDKTTPGSRGLILQPLWSPNANDYDAEARGSIIGFTEEHGRAEIYRAMIEGITFALRQGKEQVEKHTGRKIRRLVVSGGGSQSDHILQITADIFGLPVERPSTSETSGLGAAISAARGIDLFPDFKTAARKMTKTAKRFEPNTQNGKIYNQLYTQVFLKMYKQLQPSFRRIRIITDR